MPFLYWLLFPAVFSIPSQAYAAEATNTFYISAASAILLILVVVLTVYNLRLLRNQHRLQREHTQLKSFLEHSSDLVAVLDQQFQPTFLNSHLLAMTEQSLTESNELRLAIYNEEISNSVYWPELAIRMQDHLHVHFEAWLETSAAQRRIVSATLTRLGQDSAIKYLLIARDITQRKQEQHFLRQLSLKDAETGLLTPAIFSEFVQSAISGCNEQHPQLAIILIKLNPVLGFDYQRYSAQLSENLSKSSQYVSKLLPSGSVLSRYNTDTIAIMIPPHQCTSPVDIYLNRLAHKVLVAINKLPELSAKSGLQSYIGISVYPLDGDSVSTLLNSASAAISTAAKRGVSSLQFANNPMQLRAPEYQSLENELYKAAAQNEFDVYFQPKLSISSNRVVGYEALLRWHSPKRGILLPKSFLHIADETGLIIKLDRLVFRQCCEHLELWQKIGVIRGRIAVNISSVNFRQADFISTLTEQLQHNAVAGDFFELELHEDIFLQPEDKLADKLQHLISLGFHLTLDNFGNGVSSINILRNYPLHSIKIAQSFIKDMEHNEQQRNITASLIRLASYLQLDVIATGIENEMQAYLLHVMGCDILQGHLFSKALPANDIPALLAKESKLIRKEVS